MVKRLHYSNDGSDRCGAIPTGAFVRRKLRDMPWRMGPKPSNLAQSFYIEAPQLAKDGVEDDPEAVSFWKVKHGTRFTAMPSFAPRMQVRADLENRDVPQGDGQAPGRTPPQSMPSGRKYPALRPLRPRNNTNTLCDRRAKQSSVAEEKLCWQVEIADLFSDKSQTDGSRSGVPNGVKQRHGGKA